MTYTQQGDRVTLEMTRDDYDQLTVIIGYALGGMHSVNKPMFYELLRFINELNNGNPNFMPYEIPPEYARRSSE